MRTSLLRTLLATALSALAQTSFAVDWDWKLAHRFNATSPPLTIPDIPDGTKTLAAHMNDLDFQNNDQGGGTVAHAVGATADIPEGAL